MNADLSGLAGYIGAIGGILNAVESSSYKGAFLDDMLGQLRGKFRADSIAANMSGAARISHAFEWPTQDTRGVSTREPSAVPLFRLTKKGMGGMRVLSYYFMPSRKPVPLPDPSVYG